MPKPVTYIGLDLGQAQDYTALAVATRPRHRDYTDPDREPRQPPYDVSFLKRFPLGTPYTTIIPFVIDLLRTRELSGSLLLVDYTGVGQAIDEYFCAALEEASVTCRYSPITLTAGTNVTPAKEGGFLVPKKELVTAMQLLYRRADQTATDPEVLRGENTAPFVGVAALLRLAEWLEQHRTTHGETPCENHQPSPLFQPPTALNPSWEMLPPNNQQQILRLLSRLLRQQLENEASDARPHDATGDEHEHG